MLYVEELIGAGYGQHDAAGDDGCVPRSRHAARQPRRGCRRRARRHGRAGGKPASRSTRSRRGWSRTASGCSPTRPTSSTRRCRKSAARCSAASSTRCRTSCRRSSMTGSRRRSKTGARRARCGGCGPATPRCGPRPTRRNWLGWLTIVDEQLKAAAHLDAFAADVKRGDFTDALLLGMGGSSLGAEVLAESFGSKPGFPRLQIVEFDRPGADPPHRAIDRPAAHAVHRVEQIGQHARTEHLQAVFLRPGAGGRRARRSPSQHFVAITDPGSSLEKIARLEKFRAVRHGVAIDRRALFGAVRFRHGAGRGDRHRYPNLPRAHGRDGALVLGQRAAGRKPRRAARRDPRRPPRSRGATS